MRIGDAGHHSRAVFLLTGTQPGGFLQEKKGPLWGGNVQLDHVLLIISLRFFLFFRSRASFLFCMTEMAFAYFIQNPSDSSQG